MCIKLTSTFSSSCSLVMAKSPSAAIYAIKLPKALHESAQTRKCVPFMAARKSYYTAIAKKVK